MCVVELRNFKPYLKALSQQKAKKMHELHPLLADLALITVYAAITTLLFKKLKQPMVLGYLLAGILAGPHLNFLPTVTDMANLAIWADIGVIFLLLSLGLEFSFKKMASVGKSALITAVLNIFLMLFLGHFTGLFLGWSATDSFFLGAMISMSSTTIIIKAFDDLNIKKQKFVRLVFGVLVIEDLMGILLLVLLPAFALNSNVSGQMLWISAFKLLMFLVLSFITGIYLVPTMLYKIKSFLNDEMLLLLSVALCLSMVYLAVYSGFSLALGAFLMGSVLSETGVVNRIETVVKPLKDFFGAVFFISVGMLVDPQMFLTQAYPILSITLVVLVGKIMCSVLGFTISGQTLQTSVESAFSLAQVGEFAFIIAALGRAIGVLDDFVYPVIVAVSVMTTFLTPLMISSSEKAYKVLEKLLPKRLQAYINQNAVKSVSTITEEKLWRAFIKSYVARVLIFSIILYALIVLASRISEPFAVRFLPELPVRWLLLGLTLLLMSPFLKALIGWHEAFINLFKKILRRFGLKKFEPKESVCEGDFPINDKCVPSSHTLLEHLFSDDKAFVKKLLLSESRAARIYALLWYARPANRLPLLIFTGFRLALAAFFICLAVHTLLTQSPKVTAVLLLLSIVLIMQSKGLSDQYLKMENRFLDNLQGHAQQEENENINGES